MLICQDGAGVLGGVGAQVAATAKQQFGNEALDQEVDCPPAASPDTEANSTSTSLITATAGEVCDQLLA